MATKKQKRELSYQKHLAFMEEVRRTGLEAQKKDREHRQSKQDSDVGVLEKSPVRKTNRPTRKSRVNNTIKESK